MVQWRDSYKDFRYDVAFTLSTNKNKVVKLSDQVNPIIWAGSDAALNSSIYRTENGQPMGQMYGYVVDGIIQDKRKRCLKRSISGWIVPTSRYGSG